MRRLILLISLNLLFSMSFLLGSEKKIFEEINESQRLGKMLPENKKALNDVLKIVEEEGELSFSEIYKRTNKKAAFFYHVLTRLTDSRSVHYDERISIKKKNKQLILIMDQKMEIPKEREEKKGGREKNRTPLKQKPFLKEIMYTKKKERKQDVTPFPQTPLKLYPKREGPPRNAREQYEDLQRENHKRALVEKSNQEKQQNYKRRLLNKIGEEGNK